MFQRPTKVHEPVGRVHFVVHKATLCVVHRPNRKQETKQQNDEYSQLSLNGHIYKTDTSVKRTPRVGPCLSLLPLFDSL